jgi:outer membrane protein OmpA-like peptidoglycan-associated protein
VSTLPIFFLPRQHRWVRALCMAFFLCAAFLAGCQTAPPPKGLTPAQITVLKQEGFKQTDEGWEFGLSAKVLFDSNASTVKAESRANIERLAHTLLTAGIDHMRLDGHTDSTGSADYNRNLSLRRAQAVADILVAAGMAAANVQVRGLGDSKPVSENTTAEGRAQNRRVAMVLAVD